MTLKKHKWREYLGLVRLAKGEGEGDKYFTTGKYFYVPYLCLVGGKEEGEKGEKY